jgi:hypothetical protein
MAFDVETAKRTRGCGMCDGKIKAGEHCITFRHGSGMYTVQGNLCFKCCNDVLEEYDTMRCR